MGFILLPEAEFDLDGIWLHVARESSIETANRVIDSLTDRLHLLGRNPQIGRTRDHDLRPGLRSFPVGEYVIFYRVHENDILITHILRGSRDIERLIAEE